MKSASLIVNPSAGRGKAGKHVAEIQAALHELGIETGRSREALVLARGIAMTSYASAEEFGRFITGTKSNEANERQGAIGDFLEERGETFARRATSVIRRPA